MIVNVSSIGARVPAVGPVAYNTAQAALTALGKALAEEFGPAAWALGSPVRPAPRTGSSWPRCPRPWA